MKYTIGTLVTNWDEYNLMKDSFLKKGFKEEDCEFLTVDNTNGNTMDAFTGNNWFLNNAKGEYVILCHQDIRIKYDTRTTLDNRLKKLTELHPNWGLAGNAGGTSFGHRALRISDPFGFNQDVGGPFPTKTETLDGNFIIVRKDTGLGFSRDLTGFHFYDVDISLQIKNLGFEILSLYNITISHSSGNLDAVWLKNALILNKKWEKHLKENA